MTFKFAAYRNGCAGYAEACERTRPSFGAKPNLLETPWFQTGYRPEEAIADVAGPLLTSWRERLTNTTPECFSVDKIFSGSPLEQHQHLYQLWGRLIGSTNTFFAHAQAPLQELPQPGELCEASLLEDRLYAPIPGLVYSQVQLRIYYIDRKRPRLFEDSCWLDIRRSVRDVDHTLLMQFSASSCQVWFGQTQEPLGQTTIIAPYMHEKLLREA